MVIESGSGQAHPTMLTEHASTAKVFGGDTRPSSAIPVFIPADQAYYWSIRWQESERKALEDIAEGRSRTFADPNDAVRYLLSS